MRALHQWILAIGVCAFAPIAFAQQMLPNAVAEPPLPSTETIVARMVAQGKWNDRAVRSFEEIRSFTASNPRFKQQATREVHTAFRAPDSYDSNVVKDEGSRLIRQRVFDPILDAEKEAQPAKEKHEYDILPENYVFNAIGLDSCDGRKCYRVAISPRRKNKFLLEGFIWVDAEDFGLAKVQGAPSKRLSFWMLRAQVTRTYTRVGGVWLTSRIESDSDLFVAGHSNLSIGYAYSAIEIDENCRVELCPGDER